MTRETYLSRHAKLTQQLKRAGLPNPRKVFWQIPQRSARFYGVQLHSMKQAVETLKDS